jgi:hypothetical protein
VSTVALVTALLPPALGGTEILVWRLFGGDADVAVVAGADAPAGGPADDLYRPLEGPTLALPYPRLRGYKYGLAPVLGAASAAWLAAQTPRVARFLRARGVSQVVSIPHNGPFALLGFFAARALGLEHTFYVLDAWEDASTSPLERALIRRVLGWAARAPRSRLAAVSPALADHYRRTYGFADAQWIPNPTPLPVEVPRVDVAPRRTAVLSGGIKTFNEEAVRTLIRAIPRCKVVERLIVTGPAARFDETLRARGEWHDRVEFKMASREEVAVIQREAAVLVVATNVDDRTLTSKGYLPGRLPEYVAARRPVLLVGREDSEAARAVRHWKLGLTTASRDEGELAAMLDQLASEPPGAEPAERAAFLETFSRDEARRRLLRTSAAARTGFAAELAARFEREV